MAYTDDWESLMNGVFGAGGRVKFGSGAAQPDTKAKTGGLPDLNAALLEQQKQLDELLKVLKHLEQMTEQVGKPKENSFSLHKIRLPRLHLPHISIPALISLLMAAAALLLLWLGLGTVWSSFGLLSL